MHLATWQNEKNHYKNRSERRLSTELYEDAVIKRIILVLTIYLFVSKGFAAKPPKPVDELEARVAALESRPSPVQVLANGESIGAFVGDARSFITNARREIFVLSDQNYVFLIETSATDPNAGVHVIKPPVNVVEFDQSGCSGNAYIQEDSGFAVFQGQGIVIGIDNDPLNRIFYVSPTATVRTDVQTQSYWDSDDTCTESTGGEPVIQLIPNDPTMTGVPNDPFTPPITLGQ